MFDCGCAALSLWCVFAAVFYHGDTADTEVAQRPPVVLVCHGVGNNLESLPHYLAPSALGFDGV